MTGKSETAAPRDVVEIKDNGDPVGVAAVDENGRWNFNVIGLTAGHHTFTAHLGAEASPDWQLTVEHAAELTHPYVVSPYADPPQVARQTVYYYKILQTSL